MKYMLELTYDNYVPWGSDSQDLYISSFKVKKVVKKREDAFHSVVKNDEDTFEFNMHAHYSYNRKALVDLGNKMIADQIEIYEERIENLKQSLKRR